MTYYAGIDVSLEYSSICVVDGAGKIIREQRIASEPEALIAWFRGLGFGLERNLVGLPDRNNRIVRRHDRDRRVEPDPRLAQPMGRQCREGRSRFEARITNASALAMASNNGCQSG